MKEIGMNEDISDALFGFDAWSRTTFDLTCRLTLPLAIGVTATVYCLAEIMVRALSVAFEAVRPDVVSVETFSLKSMVKMRGETKLAGADTVADGGVGS